MKFLIDLNFRLVKNKQNGQNTWAWGDLFVIANTPSLLKKWKSQTIIYKRIPGYPDIDRNQKLLFRGSYIFDNQEFASELLKNVGIIELIQGTRIRELKSHIHHLTLKELGFIEIEQDVWTKGIYLIALQPPKWDNDRGKVVILKKRNIKKLKDGYQPSIVVYKGRYFFDDENFTKELLDKIGFTYFNENPKQKNIDYQFERDKYDNYEFSYLDRDLLNF